MNRRSAFLSTKFAFLLLLIAAVVICTAIPMVLADKKSRMATTSMNDRLLDEINDLRKSKGLKELTIDSTLTTIADTRSTEASKKWSHERPNGEQGTEMISSDLWRGENLSCVTYPGYKGSEKDQEKAADTMFDNLVASPAHYDNMVFKNYTKIGISSELTETSDGTKITVAYMFSN
ncbi:Cysteine-rich secretory protein family protein [Lachnospiraceae bacterium]|nr:Cysteine-rich secretory protein family protein [Lachnospiraceae bacterium]